MRDSAQPLRGRADPLDAEGVRRLAGSGAQAILARLVGGSAQEGLIVVDDEADARLDFLAARFSLRLCWAFFLSPLPAGYMITAWRAERM